MSPDDARSIEARLERLERLVDELRRAVEPARPFGAAPPGPPADAPASHATPAPHSGPAAVGRSGRLRHRLPGDTGDWRDRGEALLARGGIALLVLGLAFLFKYAVDRGWITPAIRCAFGLGVGGAMVFAGLRLHTRRRRYAQALLGGAIIVFYLVGFAAAPLYHLVPDVAAFLFMDAVAVLALVLSERQEEPALAIMGALGAGSTPALLRAWQPNGHLLLAHTALLAVWTSRLHARTGWRVLPWVAGAVAGALLLATVRPHAPGVALALATTALSWLLLAVAPALRRRAAPGAGTDPARPPGPELLTPAAMEPRALALLLTLVFAVPATALLTAPDPRPFGALLVGAAVAFALAGAVANLRGADPARPLGAAAVAGDVAAALLLPGTALTFYGAARVALLGLEAAALATLGRRLRSDGLRLLAALAFLGLGLALLQRAAAGGTGPFTAQGLAWLVTLALAAVAPTAWPEAAARTAFRLGAYVGLLTWLAAELLPLANGHLVLSLAWGACGAAMLVLGVDRSWSGAQKLGLATLGLTAGKLILVDMAEVEAVWRILLFTGFGGAFLGLAYYLKARRMRPVTVEAGADAPGADRSS